jgi:hypothetical protein
MEYFIISLLDPVLVLPALAIGYFPRGVARLWLAGCLMAAYPIIALGYGVPTPAPDALFWRGAAAACAILAGFGLSRLRTRKVDAE